MSILAISVILYLFSSTNLNKEPGDEHRGPGITTVRCLLSRRQRLTYRDEKILFILYILGKY